MYFTYIPMKGSTGFGMFCLNNTLGLNILKARKQGNTRNFNKTVFQKASTSNFVFDFKLFV